MQTWAPPLSTTEHHWVSGSKKLMRLIDIDTYNCVRTGRNIVPWNSPAFDDTLVFPRFRGLGLLEFLCFCVGVISYSGPATIE